MTEAMGAAEERRIAALMAAFGHRIRRPPAFVVRAPGRVNLLGEHTDYNGLPVLPMAIDRNILIAGVPCAERVVRVRNSARKFGARRFELRADIPASKPGDWGNYVKAAAQGLVRHCGARLACGAELLVDGNIPAGAGLSSSSALVVASALALLAANQATMPYIELAELLPAAERYVGTLSGGMDQATSLLARPGHALRIDFFPLRTRVVPLPPGYTVVVCHSLVDAEKSNAARRAYNLRVIECRLACRLLERALGTGLPRSLHTLGDLVTLFPGRPLAEFVGHLSAEVPDRPLSLAEIGAAVGTSAERLRDECQVTRELGDGFMLLRRLRHVLTEADRVNEAEAALETGDVSTFGQLMDASHRSCRDDYEISCPELEELVHAAKQAGAVGARLTGAGFGGCTVNLVATDRVEAFRTRVNRVFYRPRLSAGRGTRDCSFVFTPAPGAEVRHV